MRGRRTCGKPGLMFRVRNRFRNFFERFAYLDGDLCILMLKPELLNALDHKPDSASENPHYSEYRARPRQRFSKGSGVPGEQLETFACDLNEFEHLLRRNHRAHKRASMG